MSVTFVATDGAGNRTRVQVEVANVGNVATATAHCTTLEQTTDTTTTTTAGGITTTTLGGITTTSAGRITTTTVGGITTTTVSAAGATTTTVSAGAVMATTVGGGGPSTPSLAAQAGRPIEGTALSRTGVPIQSLAVVAMATLLLGAFVHAGSRRSPPKSQG